MLYAGGEKGTWWPGHECSIEGYGMVISVMLWMFTMPNGIQFPSSSQVGRSPPLSSPTSSPYDPQTLFSFQSS